MMCPRIVGHKINHSTIYNIEPGVVPGSFLLTSILVFYPHTIQYNCLTIFRSEDTTCSFWHHRYSITNASIRYSRIANPTNQRCFISDATGRTDLILTR